MFKRYMPPDCEGMDVPALLKKAKSASDPRDAHACLLKAESLEPDSLPVQRELLLRGNLHLRNPKTPSYDVIKCYILHAFEHPEKHSEEEQNRMTREIFDDPRLQKCLSLSEKPDDFLRSYLQDLCLDYMRIFIMPDSLHNHTLWGLTLPGRQARNWAEPASDLIQNIFLSPFLSVPEQKLLAGAFYRAFSACVNGSTAPLDALLGDALCALIE